METYWLEKTEADLPPHDDWLSPDEAVLLSRMRFAKRRADWRLGRWTAKCAAAAYLDLSAGPRAFQKIEIRPAPSGAPQLFVGNQPAAAIISVSHRVGIAVCAITMNGVALGCDLELIEPRSDGFVTDYLTGEEQALISRAPQGDRPRLVTLLWSAKESTLKALCKGLQVDTRCVAVRFGGTVHYDHPAGVFEESPGLDCWQPLQVCHVGGEIFHGWWQSTGQLVRTLVGAPAPLPPLLIEGGIAGRSSARRPA